MTAVGQTDFTAALLAPDLPVPPGLCDPQGRPAGKRFDVYRNNVTVSLMKALETAFPALAKALGAQNFQALAAVFVRQHPPTSPLMMHYGGALPGFLETFAPLARHPWLADLARLELALRASYHAADAAPVPRATLEALTPDAMLAARPRLAPALRLIRSRWPVLSLWRQQIEGAAPPDTQAGQAVLILRPDYDPVPHLLAPGGATFILALQDGQTLGSALDRATAAVPGFDLTATLGLLIGGQAVTDI